MRLALGLALGATAPASPAIAQGAASSAEPVTVESYYRIKWGGADEFKALYKRNHQPILDELKRQGFITGLRTDAPFMHMAGNQRWDLRVTITYPNASAAVIAGGAFDKASEAITKRLYPDKAKLDREEARRFSLLEEHWDVVVVQETN